MAGTAESAAKVLCSSFSLGFTSDDGGRSAGACGLHRLHSGSGIGEAGIRVRVEGGGSGGGQEGSRGPPKTVSSLGVRGLPLSVEVAPGVDPEVASASSLLRTRQVALVEGLE